MRDASIAAAAVVATTAFWAYTRTLLPGVDLGDTGGFQAAVLWPTVSARQAYPLYYNLASPFVAALSAGNPARGLNLFSAAAAALAAGMLTWVVSRIAASVIAGVVSGVFLAFSYTFWTQAVIAEVYALHLALVGACLVAIHAFAANPTRTRLACFFAVYALSFGNHFSMILMLLPFAVVLLQLHPHPRELFTPAVVLMALAIACAGALQYAPNLMSTWSAHDGADPWTERMAAFWFDTTKADWRESMVLGVGRGQLRSRAAMWAWDARQQFGAFGLALATIGAVRVWMISRPWAIFIWTAYAINTVFALTYNVGDTHVFFLPSHYLTAMAAGIAVASAAAGGRRWVAGVALAALIYGGQRAWETWPAVDRHEDRRGEQLLARMAAGLDDRGAVLVAHLDWQTENALLYGARYTHPELAWVRLLDVMPHFPFFVRDNMEIGRDLVLTSAAAAEVVAGYGPAFELVHDEALPAPALATIAERVPRGAPYIMTLLTPDRDEQLDQADFSRALAELTGARPPARTPAPYELFGGIAGQPVGTYRSSARPFRADVTLAGDRMTVRMDSWLATDTFRRGGFGHVVHGRQHALIIERGVSLVWFDTAGAPHVAYAAGLYTPKPRFRIAGASSRLARY